MPDDIRAIGALLREPQHKSLTLAEFLRETDVALEDLYRKDRAWTLLRHTLGIETRTFAEGEEDALRNVHKLLHVGDARRLSVWEALLAGEATSTEAERRVANMLSAVLYGKQSRVSASGVGAWAKHPVLREELAALLPVLRLRNRVLSEAHALEADIPLVLHARYLGVELSAAFDHRTDKGDLRDYYTGVETTAGGRYDLLLVTLEKSAATREHLRYRDFPLNARRFHWQSQSRATRDSREGRRHLNPDQQRCTSLLFVRERSDDRPGVTMGFRYLGPVLPDGDEGERPITIEWALQHAMPTELLQHGRVAV